MDRYRSLQDTFAPGGPILRWICHTINTKEHCVFVVVLLFLLSTFHTVGVSSSKSTQASVCVWPWELSFCLAKSLFDFSLAVNRDLPIKNQNTVSVEPKIDFCRFFIGPLKSHGPNPSSHAYAKPPPQAFTHIRLILHHIHYTLVCVLYKHLIPFVLKKYKEDGARL